MKTLLNSIFAMILGSIIGVAIVDRNDFIEKNKKIISFYQKSNENMSKLFNKYKIDYSHVKNQKINEVEKAQLYSLLLFNYNKMNGKNMTLLKEYFSIEIKTQEKIKKIKFNNNMFIYLFVLNTEDPAQQLMLMKNFIRPKNK